ncbi:type VII toxin-antitoxin system HepT family RNase toxin, partial [Thermococcus sp.]
MAEVENALQSLYELRGLEEEEFLKNRHYIASAKYNLLVAIEACIDIAYHLISRNKFRLPSDYADSFRVLNERGLIDDDLTKRLISMARFRN